MFSTLTASRDNYDLEQVRMIPSYAMRTWTAPSLEPQTIIFRTDDGSLIPRTLVFQENKGLLTMLPEWSKS
jgi:hypothetical protein